jgi:hypothetical protein
MASPFKYFRKHTKAFMATAAVLCMFIFVIGSGLKTGSGSRGGGPNETGMVATWNGGSLDQGQLRILVQHRVITDSFLKAMFVEGGGRNYQYDFPRNIPFLFLPDQRKNDEIDQTVVTSEVLASLASQAGMSVSDGLINHYIDEIGLKKVSPQQVEQILSHIGTQNPRQNEAIIFATLRKLLLANFYSEMFDDQSKVVMPQERWDDWKKVNERISLDVAELPRDKFLSQVPEPNDTQLQGFFNDYKNVDPTERVRIIGGQELTLPEPAFAEPHRVRLQYLNGSLVERAEKLEPTVTEDEIKAYYEKNKETDFVKLPSFDDTKDKSPETPKTEPSNSTPPAADNKAAETTPATTETPGKPSAEGAAPTTDAAKPAESQTPPAPATPTATPQTPAPASPPAEKAAPTDAKEQPKQSATTKRRSPFRFVALQAPAQNEKTSTDSKSAESQPAANAPAESTPAADQPKADATSPATPPAPAASPAAPEAKDAKPTEAKAEEKKEPATEYEPLDKVRDDIRKKLAAEKAEAELEKTFSQATAELQSEYNDYGFKVAQAEDAKQELPKPPARLADLKWLADKYNLTYEKTAPLTLLELRETPLGHAFDTNTQRISVTQAAFTTLKLFEPFQAKEMAGDRYLVLKTEDMPRHVPELKEVREQVVKAWKEQQAAKLAEQEAKKLAAEAEKASQPFDQFFTEKGYKPIKTELFSAMSYPLGRESFGTPPQLSSVPELTSIGPEFMDAAFALDGNKTVGLLNFDHSKAYVIRLNRRQYTEEELKKLFLEEEAPWPGQVGMTTIQSHVSRFNSAVIDELLKDRANLQYDPEWEKAQAERREKQANND